MEKDFWKWHGQKEQVNRKENPIFFHEGEIWWCALGANIGFEEDGKNENFERPVLIYRKFNKNIFLALPVTSRQKRGKFYVQVESGYKTFTIILSQIRLLDSKRLLRKVRTLSKTEFQEIDENFQLLIKQTNPHRGGGDSRRPKPL